jgi:guanylate kinase
MVFYLCSIEFPALLSATREILKKFLENTQQEIEYAEEESNMKNKKKLLVIAGPSGCGKTYIAERLHEEKSSVFVKLEQVTTRKKRFSEENTYHFINEDIYRQTEESLIAKTNIDGNLYGTIPQKEEDDRVGIIIANRKGIEDLKASGIEDRFDVYYLGIDSEIPEKRHDRNDSFVQDERDSLKDLMNSWLVNTKERYITVDDVMDVVSHQIWIKK